MPALPGNTYHTSHGFLFRVVVPESLRAVIGKREIKKSLGKDYRAAVSEARLLALQVDRQFAQARKKLHQKQGAVDAIDAFLARPIDKRLKPITKVTPELTAGLCSLWLASLEADAAWRREGLDDEDYDALQCNVSEMQALLARGAPEPFIPAVHSLLVGRGYELAVSPEAERQLVLDLLPALQEGYDILAQRQAGRMVKPRQTDAPPLPAAWERPREPTPAGLTWETLFAHWREPVAACAHGS